MKKEEDEYLICCLKATQASMFISQMTMVGFTKISLQQPLVLLENQYILIQTLNL